MFTWPDAEEDFSFETKWRRRCVDETRNDNAIVNSWGWKKTRFYAIVFLWQIRKYVLKQQKWKEELRIWHNLHTYIGRFRTFIFLVIPLCDPIFLVQTRFQSGITYKTTVTMKFCNTYMMYLLLNRCAFACLFFSH